MCCLSGGRGGTVLAMILQRNLSLSGCFLCQVVFAPGRDGVEWGSGRGQREGEGWKEGDVISREGGVRPVPPTTISN